MTKEMREISNIPITIKVKYDGNKLPVSDGILGAIIYLYHHHLYEHEHKMRYSIF